MATQTKWVSDPPHSEISFRAKHMMITNVNGSFRKFKVEAGSDGSDFIGASTRVTIDAESIFTNATDRDNHLKSPDFLDVEKFKEIIFTGKSLTTLGDNRFKLKGDLKIRDIKREVDLDVEFGGINKDPWGKEKAGFSVTGKINRKDWGLNWNAALETGGVLVSDEIRISAEIQLEKQE